MIEFKLVDSSLVSYIIIHTHIQLYFLLNFTQLIFLFIQHSLQIRDKFACFFIWDVNVKEINKITRALQNIQPNIFHYNNKKLDNKIHLFTI